MVDLNKTEILTDVHEEPLWITTGKYALFMSYGKIGIDSMALYMHYQFTATLQRSNQVWAADKYCREGLDWGRDRFEKAKQLLTDLGIIEIIKNKNSKGQFGKSFVKLKRGKVDLEPSDLDRLPENKQADLPTSGQTATNALSNNINALSNNRNALLELKNKFNEMYKKLYGKDLYFDKKESITAAGIVKKDEKEVEERMDIYFKMCSENPGYYIFLPTKFIQHWNKLVVPKVETPEEKYERITGRKWEG